MKFIDPKDTKSKETRAVAKLGLKALNRRIDKGFYDVENEIEKDTRETNSNIDWFLFEDQTIGFPEIASLIYNGWSAEEVKKAISETDAAIDAGRDGDEMYNFIYTGQHPRGSEDEKAAHWMFAVANSWQANEFAEDCEAVLKEESAEK